MAGIQTPIVYWYVFGSLRPGMLEETLDGGPLMPALAELGQHGLRFDNAFSASGSPMLSAASMLTGQWPSRLGMKDCPIRVQGQGEVQAFGLDSAVPTLPGWLAERGFSTFSHPDGMTPFPGDGLERGFTNPRALPDRIEEGQGIFIWHQAKGAAWPPEPTGLARDALGLDENDEKNNPNDLYRAAAFDADRGFARAMGELSQAGLWENSLVLVTACCGCELQEHGGLGAPTGLYQENLAVPLFIKFPAGHSLAEFHGQTITPRVRLIDLVPTLARIAVGQEFAPTDGEDLAGLISGQDKQDRDLIGFHSALAKSDGGLMVHEALGVIKGSQKALSGFRADGQEFKELYDLSADPAESRNLAEEEPELFQELMIEAAARGMEAEASSCGTAPEPTEDDKEALTEKLRSLGYL